jgi:serine/threonine protein kinase
MDSHEWSIADDPGQKPLTPGTQVGSYRVEFQLGEGGMGTVYRALDTKLNRPVAIKVLSDDLADAAARRRFQREAQMASSLNHPHIVTVYDVGEFEGRQYLVTEYVDGGTLKDWAQREKPAWRQIVELLAGVADGLAAAHAAGILHRDIKPANILVATPLTERAFDGEKAGIPLVRLNRSPSVQICTVSGTTSTAYSRLHVPVGFLFLASNSFHSDLLICRTDRQH